ncbi:MAG: chromosome segregation protein SMC [Deltaproteobacteria bacterium]|nr:chromosome segregation protein SMC [Deltaproteobacteria bacterium]
MKIKRLEICGFKSFADRTVLAFDEDITGVVGPNGCGKSNVVDAIRWVMGEQSAKHLRGREMFDVIFAGSESREGTGMAEVTLTFDNKDGLAPLELAAYPEIAITRRLFRTGESEYLLNKTPCRLKDITDVFLGTGVGTKAYSIVEQGRIGFIVSSRPQDRRHLIEEAAGITKYQSRKKAAERKMEATRQNLLRVGDVVAEIQKNLSSLKYQAQKAERYKTYKAEIRDIDLHVAAHRWLELAASGKVLEGLFAGHSEEAASLERGHERGEVEIDALRLDLATSEAELDRRQGQSYELDNRVRLRESEIEHLRQDLDALRARERDAESEIRALEDSRRSLGEERERLDAELSGLAETERLEAERLERAEDELVRAREAEGAIESRNEEWRGAHGQAVARLAAAQSAIRSLERRCEESEARLERARAERESAESRLIEVTAEALAFEEKVSELRERRSSIGTRRSEVEDRLRALGDLVGAAERDLESIKEELGRKRSRLHALEEMLARYDGASRGARALLETGDLRVVADVFDVPPALEPPMAAVLGRRIQHVVMAGVPDALSAIQRLRTCELGRANVVPAAPRTVVGPRRELPDRPGVVGYLADQVGHAPQDDALARLLIGDVILVEDLEAGIALWQRGTDGRDLVTREGELIEASGAMAGGGREETAEGLLHARHEVRTLAREVEALEARFACAATVFASHKAEKHELETAVEALLGESHQGELEIVTSEQAWRRAQEEVTRTQDRIDALAREACDLAGVMAEAALELGIARSDADRARREGDELAAMLEEGSRDLDAARRATLARADEVTESKVRAAAAREKAEGVRAAACRVDQAQDEVGQRGARLKDEIERGAAKQGHSAAALLGAREELCDLVVQAEAARSAAAEMRARCEGERQDLGERESALKLVRSRLDEVRQKLGRLELSMREEEVHLSHLLEQVQERYGIALPSVLGDYHMREQPDDSLRERLGELNRLVARMGEINLTAIQDHAEQSKRLEFLTDQKSDLENALGQLESAITKMNRESRKLFRETFDAVNERFKELFPRLFRGGRASLELTAPDDLLETGVEILAQPPGKKLASIELMSGGEKALTAVALIFAMFQVRPSPFCLLDEVDAPLDEANVGRFIEVIREMTERSQFILITHSKRTMEKTDILYGITMQEPGISKLVSVRLREAAPPAVAA